MLKKSQKKEIDRIPPKTIIQSNVVFERGFKNNNWTSRNEKGEM